MPKQSKVTCSKPGAASPVKEKREKFYCTRCTREFTRQKNNFPSAQSPIYRENDGYLHVCNHCVDEMFLHYREVLGDEKAALKRICLKFDIYWGERVYDIIDRVHASNSRVRAYISKSNLIQFKDKTYDDTIDEETKQMMGLAYTTAVNPESEDEDAEISEDIVAFWGSGLAPSFYEELERKYKHWCKELGRDSNTMDVGEKAIIKQICMLEVTINRDTALGKATDKSINTLNTLLGSANMKPVQKKESLDAATEMTPFGVWIRKIEDTRPISEPDPEFRDVDGIIKYISVWFLGHLCKMLKLNNRYSRLYEEEMSRLRVERPEYEGEDEEAIFEDIFERATANEDDDSEVEPDGD